MKLCERCKMKFTDVLGYIEHKNTFKHSWKPMDPAVKDVIVKRVEDRLRPFLLGHGVKEATVVLPKQHVEIVIERFPFVEPHGVLAGLPEPNWAGI